MAFITFVLKHLFIDAIVDSAFFKKKYVFHLHVANTNNYSRFFYTDLIL